MNDPWLDSQMRFLGAMWAGWGVLMIWACRNLDARGDVFDILAAVLFLGGCGRIASLLIHADSPGLLMSFAGLEIVVAPAVMLLRRFFGTAESPNRRHQPQPKRTS